MEMLCWFKCDSQEGARSWRTLNTTLRGLDLILQMMGKWGGVSAEAQTLTQGGSTVRKQDVSTAPTQPEMLVVSQDTYLNILFPQTARAEVGKRQPTGQIWPAACFCRSHTLRVVFTL